MNTDGFVVAIDTREQRPYRFPRGEVKTLRTGDYSIVGLEDRVAIERKSRADAYGSVGRGRARFEREFVRLAALDYAAVVVECSLPEFLTPPPHTRMHPQAALVTLIAWSVKYRVFLFFAGDRRHAQALTYQLLKKYWRYRQETMGHG